MAKKIKIDSEKVNQALDTAKTVAEAAKTIWDTYQKMKGKQKK